MDSRETTSATGGSARSQADSMDQRAWRPRPVLSWTIRAAILVGPLIAGVVAVKYAIVAVPRPHGAISFVFWMAALIAVSVLTSIVVQRFLRKFAPLGVLFKMSLVFPDEAPSRFRTAMKSGGTRALARRFESKEAGRPIGPEQAAAEELVTLMARVNRHDRLTRGHSERVRAFSIMLGEEIGLSQDELDKLNWAALVHDIGKLDVPEAILNKSGRPTSEEWEVLRNHPAAAAAYVEPLRGWLGEWIDATTQHHERFDGDGYPNGLAGLEISRSARIVAIADAYDVMTATRSYKKALPAEQARAELLRNAGSQFDPGLVRSFLEISLGRMRWVVGPLGWLTHFPEIIRAPLTTIAGAGTSMVTVSAVTVTAMAAGTLAPVNGPSQSGEPEAIAAVVATVPGDGPSATFAVGSAAESGDDPIADDGGVDLIDEIGAATTSTNITPSTTRRSNTTTRPPGTTSSTISTTSTTTTSTTTTTTSSTATTTTSTSTTTAATTTTSTSTTTAAPTTTTTSTTTAAPTTTTTTTTTTPPASDQSWFIGTDGQTTSQQFLSLDGSLSGGSLANYDTDRNGDPGLTIQKGDGLSETDSTKVQRWWAPIGPIQLEGTPRLKLWVAIKDFDDEKEGDIAAGIYDCAANKTDCDLLSSGSASFDQGDFDDDEFGKVTITMPAINVTLGSGRGLMLKVASTDNSDDDLWIAYGNTSYPTELLITA